MSRSSLEPKKRRAEARIRARIPGYSESSTLARLGRGRVGIDGGGKTLRDHQQPGLQRAEVHLLRLCRTCREAQSAKHVCASARASEIRVSDSGRGIDKHAIWTRSSFRFISGTTMGTLDHEIRGSACRSSNNSCRRLAATYARNREAAHTDHCRHRVRVGRRSREMSCGWHGRLHREAIVDQRAQAQAYGVG
jgi:hypothetical protein